MRAVRALFIVHGAERTPEGRSLLLLLNWLSPAQREQFTQMGYFDVLGSDSGKRYRIHAGASVNVCEIDQRGRLQEGLCFMPIGALPIGDVMLAQKVALETCEGEVRCIARRFTPNRFHFRQTRPLG
ncbi:hypothetical protein MTX26_18225 [Bradyrhizobium sp. ISRA443]|uniref:hypothetical protein n=1 Tax=unclassified Bradyrhizobium TaxID=2631580 RepID=UPI002479AA90|nr:MULTISPECIES: hypothetical protein [unclassified Bradyrhizobium]WGR96123.1 hypothetical protein MTX20_28865 [Bradyrhizobium sp. ISRA435]WGR96423.1 hypothetical protein MTX23_18235 [Bradyrhizobium sp. ISRA436]WGS03308.1 hypothetical protein MTX18_18225 [Bradyrhizobium sp. ISRA437]WGS10192.1 hypothetical protein MTX26_18225 [Bradyrhizobium sp. ISRA443]